MRRLQYIATVLALTCSMSAFARQTEQTDFAALKSEFVPSSKIAKTEAFLAKYPNSSLVHDVRAIRFTALIQLGMTEEAARAADEAIAALVLLRNRTSDDMVLLYYHSTIQMYQQLEDIPKMTRWGDRAVAFKPNDMQTLLMFSRALAETVPTNDREKRTQMDKAEKLANSAVAALPAFLSSTNNLDAAAKAEITGQLQYTLGLIHFHQNKFALSQQEFLAAIARTGENSQIDYRLGMAYAKQKKQDAAIEALAKSVFLSGAPAGNAFDLLKQLWLEKNKSEAGLLDYIEATRAKIPKSQLDPGYQFKRTQEGHSVSGSHQHK